MTGTSLLNESSASRYCITLFPMQGITVLIWRTACLNRRHDYVERMKLIKRWKNESGWSGGKALRVEGENNTNQNLDSFE